MSLVYWDSMLFIYLLEGDPAHLGDVRRIRDRIQARGDELCTSVFTAAEVLSGPMKSGKVEQVERVRALFRLPDFTIIDFRLSTAEIYAKIRASHRISPADAIHLACAAEAEVDLFLTNDKELHGKKISGIQFIAGLDVNVL